MAKLNFLTKQEVEIIKKYLNTKTGKIANNGITLGKDLANNVTLKTNGVILNGIYADQEEKLYVAFTYAANQERAYIDDVAKRPIGKDEHGLTIYETVSVNYSKYGPICKEAARCAMKVPAILGKYRETKAVINALMNKNGGDDDTKMAVPTAPSAPTSTPEVPTAQAPTKGSSASGDVNVMKLAHDIRRALELEGHYHAQMKMAMQYAWQVVRGVLDIHGINIDQARPEAKMEAPITAPAAPELEVPTQEPEVVCEAPEVPQQESAPEEPAAVTELPGEDIYYFYLKSFEKEEGTKKYKAIFHVKYGEADRQSGALVVRSVLDLDKKFSANVLPSLIKAAPSGAVIELVGEHSLFAITNNAEMSKIVADKKIVIKMVDVKAPSGDAA